MKKIIFEDMEEKVSHDEVDYTRPVFAKKNKEFTGMLIQDDRGWSLMLGGRVHSAGYYLTPTACMKASLCYGYTFHVV